MSVPWAPYSVLATAHPSFADIPSVCKVGHSISHSGSQPAPLLATECGVFIGATSVYDEQPVKLSVHHSENRTRSQGVLL